jgi:hypothetical protein
VACINLSGHQKHDPQWPDIYALLSNRVAKNKAGFGNRIITLMG